MKKEQIYYYNYIDDMGVEQSWSGSFYELCKKFNVNGAGLRKLIENNELSVELHSYTHYTDFKYDGDKNIFQSKIYWNELCVMCDAKISESICTDYAECSPKHKNGAECVKEIFGLNCCIKPVYEDGDDDSFGPKYWFVILPKKYYSFIIKTQDSHISTMKHVCNEIIRDIEVSKTNIDVHSKVKYAGWLNWINIQNYKITFDFKLCEGEVKRWDGGTYKKYSFFDLKPHYEKLSYLY